MPESIDDAAYAVQHATDILARAVSAQSPHSLPLSEESALIADIHRAALALAAECDKAQCRIVTALVNY